MLEILALISMLEMHQVLVNLPYQLLLSQGLLCQNAMMSSVLLSFTNNSDSARAISNAFWCA